MKRGTFRPTLCDTKLYLIAAFYLVATSSGRTSQHPLPPSYDEVTFMRRDAPQQPATPHRIPPISTHPLGDCQSTNVNTRTGEYTTANQLGEKVTQ